jgi:sigma-B regulation protein RsbU (phosphoserine phosphatase)
MIETTTLQEVEELLLLQRVSQRISLTLDLKILLNQIVSDVAETFGYVRSAVLLKDDETNELVITHGWTGDTKNIGDRFEIGRSGIAGHVGQTELTHYAPDVLVDPYYEISHPSTRSELDIPLKVRGRFIGIFNVQHTTVDAFPSSRIRLLEALSGHLATAIDNARLFEREHVDKERLLKELQEAKRIQTSLLPSRDPTLTHFTMTGVCLPSRTVGGDWYDFVPMPDGRMGIVVADVAGKSMAAALLMSSTRSILRLVAQGGGSPAEVLCRVNRILLDDFPTARFVTMVFAVVDPEERSVVFANAGHLPPLFVEPAGAAFLETAEGLPLGIREGAFSERTVRMPPGRRLVLYSDGVVEASSSSREEYGLARIQDHFTRPGTSLDSLLEDVRRFSANKPLADDATVVVLEAGE